jgi:tRNA 2-selenouridine synthase
MPPRLPVAEFLNAPGVILDVRSPGEYAHGHIPGAVSFPLFSNEERVQIGTCYTQQGQEDAIELGLAIAGPKMADFVANVKALAPDRVVRLYCWRGGMRSGSMAWLLETARLSVVLLEGGYKAFRRWVLLTLSTPLQIRTLAGMTGTGKTAVLQALAALGEQMLDLEAYANHRGSSYGNLGLPSQPSNEHFENLIAVQYPQLDTTRPIWIEAESRRIGSCQVPAGLFEQMLKAPIWQLERPLSERIEFLLEIYGQQAPEILIVATQRLENRLGGLRTQHAIAAIQQGDLRTAIALVLTYYDKTYTHDLQQRQVPIQMIEVTGCSPHESAVRLIEKL